jgi:hypothetical protein
MIRLSYGASNLLAIVIVVILTIGLGIFIFTMSSGLFRNKSMIEDVSMDSSIRYGDGYAVLTVKVENLGNVMVKRITVYSDEVSVNGSPLNVSYIIRVGGGAMYQNSINIDNNFVKNPVKVNIEVGFADGGEERRTIYIYPEYSD